MTVIRESLLDIPRKVVNSQKVCLERCNTVLQLVRALKRKLLNQASLRFYCCFEKTPCVAEKQQIYNL